jgi:hypothetical protein
MGKRIKRERKKGNQEAMFFGPHEERPLQGRSIPGQVVRRSGGQVSGLSSFTL